MGWMRHITNLKSGQEVVTDKVVFKLRSYWGDGINHVGLGKEHCKQRNQWIQGWEGAWCFQRSSECDQYDWSRQNKEEAGRRWGQRSSSGPYHIGPCGLLEGF